jgi:hypothetical protein
MGPSLALCALASCFPSYGFVAPDGSAGGDGATGDDGGMIADAPVDSTSPADARGDASFMADSAADSAGNDASHDGAGEAAAEAGPNSPLLDTNFPITADLDNTNGTTLSTPTFATPGPNRLLVAVFVWGSDANISQEVLTVSGGGLTWTQQTLSTFPTGGVTPGTSGDAIWTAWVAAQVSGVTVTATRMGTDPAVMTLAIYSFSNASQSLGAMAQYGDSTSNSTLISTISATQVGSVIVGGYHAGCAGMNPPPQSNTVWDFTDNSANAPCGHFTAAGRLVGPVQALGNIVTGSAYSGPYIVTTTVEVLPAP